MPSISSADPATQSALQRALPLPHYESQANSAHNRVLRAMLDAATGRERKLLTRVEDLIALGRLRDESMAILMHELRNPLASIQNALTVLRLRSQDESLRVSMHGLIERQVRQIALITSTLGDMSGRSVGQLQLQRKRVNLRVVITRAAETVAPELTQRLHDVSFSWPESCIWVFADAGRLEQVFVNLFSNASKYTDEGGRIVVSMQASDGYAVVKVRDSGIGISADAMPHIFGLFIRGETTAVRKRSGLGIGLALVRSILDSHGGTVSAHSAGVGQGSEFTVRLKLGG
jgi:signal transduction histidine kinase